MCRQLPLEQRLANRRDLKSTKLPMQGPEEKRQAIRVAVDVFRVAIARLEPTTSPIVGATSTGGRLPLTSTRAGVLAWTQVADKICMHQ